MRVDMRMDLGAGEALLPNGDKSTSSRARRPVKLVTEAVRECEAFKYAPFFTTDFRINQSGRPMPSSELTTSSDSVLTGLAKLGLYQTGTERAFISLFDTNYQYIVAEATLSTPLTPGLPSDKCPTRLLLCGNAIRRNHGACEHVLYTTNYPGSIQPHKELELPLTLVPDLLTDDRFSSKPYCQIGESPQFYAAVPIRTNKGINIGTYSLRSSNKLLDDWNDECTRSLREISSSIMDYFEANRSRHAYRRNERVNRGLGSFIEGKSTLSGWQHGPNVKAFEDNSKFEGGLDTMQQRFESQGVAQNGDEPEHSATVTYASGIGASDFAKFPTERPLDVTKACSFASLRKLQNRFEAAQPGYLGPHEPDSQTGLRENDRGAIFSKAANIIRESFEIEGCLFFDVTVGSYRAPTVQSPFSNGGGERPSSRLSSASSSDDQLFSLPAEDHDVRCELLGFSTSDGSSINRRRLAQTEGNLPKQFLAKLLRRYPEGKIFNFDAVGELQSSDSSDDDRGPCTTVNDLSRPSVHDNDTSASTTTEGRENKERQPRRVREGALIHKMFAFARSVAFIPVWDSKRERWFAGGFAYTQTPARAFTVEGELSLLKGFSKLITAEVHKLETQQVNQAKSDALGSLSHELRSPLHGVVLGIELLNDTDLTVFQGNATHTIETCCRTLMDTIDHLLDYAKVNSFAAPHKQASTVTPWRLRQRAGSAHFGKRSLYLNARFDGLVEEVMETVFAGFNFQYMSVRQLSRHDAWMTQTDEIAHNQMDAAQAMEQLGPGVGDTRDGGQRLHFGDVSVYLQVDQTCNWMFHLPGGAIRRIILNLFGNSLKFTTQGAIWVSLSQEKASAKRTRTDHERIITLSVQDTGRGIGQDYMQHRLFQPFAQENELSPGTGLGLSLVKKIVSQLHGQISVQSQVDVGTRITVHLPLAQSPANTDKTKEDQDFEDQVQELTGLRVQLAGFSTVKIAERNRLAMVEDICRNSLHMEVVSPDIGGQLAPDIVLWLEYALPESFGELSDFTKTPNVVICRDALAAYRRFSIHESAGYEGVFDFISQPIGPRKLAKSIQLAYKRWMSLPKIPSPPVKPPGSSKSNSLYGGRLNDEAVAPVQPSNPMPFTESAANPELINPQPQHTSPTLARTVLVSDASLVCKKPAIANKILLVDDNHINLKILSAYMSKLGRPHEAVVNGREARDTYIQNPDCFVAILMDISMPVMDGLEATRQIRNFERHNQLRPVAILALTGLASHTTQREASESGVDIFLTKPVRLVALREAMELMRVFS